MMLHSNGLRSLPQLHVNDKVRRLQGYRKCCCFAVLSIAAGTNGLLACSSSVMPIPYKNWKTLGSSRMSLMPSLLKKVEYGSEGSIPAAAADLPVCRQSDTNVRLLHLPRSLRAVLWLSQDTHYVHV